MVAKAVVVLAPLTITSTTIYFKKTNKQKRKEYQNKRIHNNSSGTESWRIEVVPLAIGVVTLLLSLNTFTKNKH